MTLKKPNLLKAITKVLPKEKVDLAVFTGDYRDSTHGPYDHILEPLQSVVSQIQTNDGFIAILGNHDSHEMVPDLEKLGLQVPINETLTLKRSGASIHLTGLDDVHYYYTQAASDALEKSPKGFKIALVHSSEIANEAADHGYHLYLCGHSHGGQIYLPFGFPVITHTDMKRKLARGIWKFRKMTGYTNPGAGVVLLPLRFFCPPEITLITLRSENIPA